MLLLALDIQMYKLGVLNINFTTVTLCRTITVLKVLCSIVVTLFITRCLIDLELFPSNENVMEITFDQ